MFDASGFVSSMQGQQALQKLQAQGFAPQQAQAMLGAAVPAATQALRSVARGDQNLPKFGESNYVMNFTAAAVSGLIRGEGFFGSAMDGLQGAVGGYIAQVIAARFGLPKRTAGIIGAIITPMAIDFIWSKLEGAGSPAPAAPQPAAVPPAPAAPPPTAYGAYGRPTTRGYGYALPAHAATGYAVPSGQPARSGYYTPPAGAPTYHTVPGYRR